MNSTTQRDGIDPLGAFSPAARDFPDRFPWGRWTAVFFGLGLMAAALVMGARG